MRHTDPLWLIAAALMLTAPAGALAAEPTAPIVATPDGVPEAAADAPAAEPDSAAEGGSEDTAAEDTAAEDTAAEDTAAPAPRPQAPAEAPLDDATPPQVLHAPRHAVTAGEPVEVRARIVKDWQLGPVRLRYRDAAGVWRDEPFTRSGDLFVARIPGEHVRTGTLAYAIESTAPDGTLRHHFASVDAPHVIAIGSSAGLDREAVRLQRYDGKRNRVLARGELFAYGSRYVSAAASDLRTDRYSDQYWRGEVEFTRRVLGDHLHDFRFGIGVMRAEWPTVGDAPQYADDSPGINYGFGEMNFELDDWWQVGGRLLLGASAEGFVGGYGAVTRIGNAAGTHFSAQVDVIGDIGTRTDLRLHWDTVPRVPMALGIELTDWPSSERAADAANLSYDVGYRFDGGLTVMARVGNAKRASSLDGGWQGGLSAAYAF